MADSRFSLKLTRTVDYQLPAVPNYIFHMMPAGRRQDGFTEGDKTDIADMTTAELQAIGRAWTAALIEKASRRHEARGESR